MNQTNTEWKPQFNGWSGEAMPQQEDSFDSLCWNLVGLHANEIPIQEKDWMTLARRIAAAQAYLYNQPDWVSHPSEFLEAGDMTLQNFRTSIAAGESGYTLSQLFEYISDDSDISSVSDTVLMSGFVNEKWCCGIYKKLASAIAHAASGSKVSAKKFLETETKLGTDVTEYRAYCDRIEQLYKEQVKEVISSLGETVYDVIEGR